MLYLLIENFSISNSSTLFQDLNTDLSSDNCITQLYKDNSIINQFDYKCLREQGIYFLNDIIINFCIGIVGIMIFQVMISLLQKKLSIKDDTLFKILRYSDILKDLFCIALVVMLMLLRFGYVRI